MSRFRENSLIGLRLAFAVVILALLVLALFTSAARAADAAPARVVIPERSALYQFRLIRAVTERFNDSAPASRLAAQLHQESRWKHDAQSPVSAQGLAQFMPATAQWIGTICRDLGPPDPWNPDWAMRAQACYMRWLVDRNTGATRCDRWAFAFSDYNGGMRWRQRDQALARAAGSDPERWFGHVATHRSRSTAAHRENREYVERILHVLEPAYLAAGWPGSRACG